MRDADSCIVGEQLEELGIEVACSDSKIMCGALGLLYRWRKHSRSGSRCLSRAVLAYQRDNLSLSGKRVCNAQPHHACADDNCILSSHRS